MSPGRASGSRRIVHLQARDRVVCRGTERAQVGPSIDAERLGNRAQPVQMKVTPRDEDPGTVRVEVAGWEIVPEGGLVHRGEEAAVIADVHLGYEWARGNAGDCVPAHSLSESIARLETMLARAPIRRLIVAGDLVESPRPCSRTAEDVERLVDWLQCRCIELVLLEGNHDRSLSRRTRRVRDPRPSRVPSLLPELVIDGWTIVHGHRPISVIPSITGHHHPVLRVAGYSAPCFLVSCDQIVLPAFSHNAAGCNVTSARTPKSWSDRRFRCILSTGMELLDFGPLTAVAETLSHGM